MSDEATFLASLNGFLREHVPGTHFVASPATPTSPARYSLRGLDDRPVPLNAAQRDQIIEALGRRGVPPHTIVPTGTSGDARMSILQEGRVRHDGLDYHGVRQNGAYPTVQNVPAENWRMGVLSADRMDAIQRQNPPQRGTQGLHETPSQYARAGEPHARVQPSPNRGRYAALATPFIAAASMLFGDNANAATGQQDQRPTNTEDLFRIIGGQHPSHDTAVGQTFNAGYQRVNDFMLNTVRPTIDSAVERVAQVVTPPRPPSGPKQ